MDRHRVTAMTSAGSLLRPAPRTGIRRAEATGGENACPRLGQRAYHRGGRRKCQSGHPDRYVFLDARTREIRELQHNLGNGKEVMVAPQDMQLDGLPGVFRRRVRQGQEKIDAPVC